MPDPRELLLNHCPRAVSYLYAHKQALGQPVTENDMEQLLVRLLKKVDMYSRMEKGDRS